VVLSALFLHERGQLLVVVVLFAAMPRLTVSISGLRIQA
jgi:hypothetical protein